MNKLIQTEICSIIYGTFRGKENQELFRCPKELDSIDLKNYVNNNRCLLGFEADEVADLKNQENYLGYYRLYFRGGWFGSWMEGHTKVDEIDCVGVDEIIQWLRTNFPKGCSWDMEDYLAQYPNWGGEKRYLLKPLYSDCYKVMFDTTYGNGDYPVRIYVYKQNKND